MALAGVAAAAESYDVWTKEHWTGTSEGTVTTEDVSITLQDFTTGDLSMKVNSYVDGSYQYTTLGDYDLKAGSGATNSYTLMAFVKFDSISGENFIFGTGSDHSGGIALSCMDGVLNFTQKSKAHNSTDVTVSTDTWYHIAYAYDNTTNKVELFLNGESKGSITLGTDYAGPTGSNVYFGAASTNGSQDNFDGSIGRFQVVKGVALDAEGVKYVANNIPEPATATLSLLALAGLAARRRRRASH